MATLKQIDANRRNALRSTGPQTAEGKQSSSTNALKSGIYAEAEIIPGEIPADLAALTSEYHARFHPTTPEARDLVDSLIRNSWLLRRLARAEASIFNCDCPQCEKYYQGRSDDAIISGRHFLELKKLDLLQRRINSTERNYHRSLKLLQDLPSPEPCPQPTETEPISEELASFQQDPQDLPSPQPGPVLASASSPAVNALDNNTLMFNNGHVLNISHHL